MITEKQITELIVKYFSTSDKFLVEVMIKPVNRIMVFIDGDQGVVIEDCRALSRHIEENLDREKEDFDLTVSSSGADRSLKLPRQYRKYLGKSLEVKTDNGFNSEGLLTGCDENGITLELLLKKSKKETEKKEVVLKYSEIKSAKPVLSFKHS